MSTVHSLLGRFAPPAADAAAIEAPSREPLTHAELDRHRTEFSEFLLAHGATGGDVVASVLPNGPVAAVAFLGIVETFASAPLNPRFTTSELDFYLGDLSPEIVVVAGDGTPARGTAAEEVAAARGITVVALDEDARGPAGAFAPRLVRAGAAGAAAAKPALPDDTALVLHTSGTTSAPKLVPLTRANLRASIASITSVLQLTERDRCLGLMPLFHVHGLVASLLSSLAAGGSLSCCPPFQGTKVATWLRDADPTWLTAVPTMHSELLRALGGTRERSASLRFVRSSSAALAPRLMAELERALGVPAIEAYGMTEAAHQISSNPLPPGERKAGSVGLPAGPEIVVLDDDGREVAVGAEGEIAIRGPNVITSYAGDASYADDAAASDRATPEGWLRTGDAGRFDGDGYLSITGRLKEIINRGGEKIAPREIEEVLGDHPAVEGAVVFACPHDRLGEEVAAAVVLRDTTTIGEAELRTHVGTRLAAFKVPTRIVLVEELPKGPTGKHQRVGLAERLGLVADR
jgi:oxalate---CoA ligase